MHLSTQNSEPRRAIFLDRDGTINRDLGFVYKQEDVELLPSVTEALGTLCRLGYLLIIITNQSGVGRGYFSEGQVKDCNKRLLELLRSKGVEITAIYYCPHHPEDGCNCRKPKPGLIMNAASEYCVDLSKSYMVGDKLDDVHAGINAGCHGVLLGDHEDWNGTKFADLLQFSQWLMINARKAS